MVVSEIPDRVGHHMPCLGLHLERNGVFKVKDHCVGASGHRLGCPPLPVARDEKQGTCRLHQSSTFAVEFDGA